MREHPQMTHQSQAKSKVQDFKSLRDGSETQIASDWGIARVGVDCAWRERARHEAQNVGSYV